MSRATRRDWNRGAGVRIELEDGSVIGGQVWAEDEEDGRVWVALNDGRYARVAKSTGGAQITDSHGRPLGAGKVAA